MNGAHFEQPQYLWALLLVAPALAGFFWWSWRVKQKLIRQFVGARLLEALMVGVSRGREKARLALVGTAVIFLFAALARPQWGFGWEEARQQGLDIIVAVDTSRSMLAQDVAPNRLERAKLAALDLMRLAKSDRLGLVAFAGTAFLQSPLTLDEEAFRQNVNALQVGIIPQGGTALSAAIRTAMDGFEKGNENHKVLVLMTDGEDHDVDTETMAAAKEAAEAGVMIFTMGVGTPAGEVLRVKDDKGNMEFVKDEQGNAVQSRLNQTLLQQIATTAKGFYLPLMGADPMKTLYDRGLAPLPKTTANTKLTRVYQERFRWPLALALLCLAVEFALPEGAGGRKPKMSAGVVALLFLLLSSSVQASPASAYSDYQKGKFDAALDEYSRLATQKTNDYRLNYNAGAAAYKAKEFDQAIRQWNAALQSPEMTSDREAQQHAFYDLGNAQFRLGEPIQELDDKRKQWEQAVASYDRAVRLNTNDVDARNNLAYVKQKLEELKKQQQQQKQQQKNDQNKDQKNDQNKDQQQKSQQNQQQKDQQNQDQKDSQNPKNQQQKDSQNQKDQQQQAKNNQQQDQKQQPQQGQKDKDQQSQQAQPNPSDQRDKEQNPANPEQAGARMMQMSPQEARQLLDAQRDDEQALIFQPTNMASPPPNVLLKDW